MAFWGLDMHKIGVLENVNGSIVMEFNGNKVHQWDEMRVERNHSACTDNLILPVGIYLGPLYEANAWGVMWNFSIWGRMFTCPERDFLH